MTRPLLEATAAPSRPPTPGGEAAGPAGLFRLLEQLAPVERLIRLHASHARSDPSHDEGLGGLQISEAEVDSLLAGPTGLPPWAVAAHGDPEVEGILARRAAPESPRSAQRSSRLDRLTAAFGLGPVERDAVLVCLAPQVDRRYERLFAYLQDDVTRRRPSIGLVLDLLSRSLEQKLKARALFEAGAPLLRFRLLESVDESPPPGSPLLARGLQLEDRVTSYLLGSDELDSRLAPYACLVEPDLGLDDLIQPTELKRRLETLVRPDGLAREPIALYLRGSRGAGRKSTAAALCRKLGRNLLRLDLGLLEETDDRTWADLLALTLREARLQAAVLCCLDYDALAGDGRRHRRRRLLRAIAELDGFVILLGRSGLESLPEDGGPPILDLPLPEPTHAERERLWRRRLQGDDLDSTDLETLVAAFRQTPGQIREAVDAARLHARCREPESPRPTAADLTAASRRQSRPTLGKLARKIEPRYGWDDIVLPADSKQMLREIANHMRHRGRVFEDWGFGRKLSLGRGLNVLFAGPPGTGKTMAAEILAGELGLDLYRIDLSSVVSKYIGETEKNLSRIFEEAECASAILFFDEADALFGKRTEVRDAHDRYANIEVSYLLQRMEEYDGAVVLATNLSGNMDDAFVRRFHFRLDLPAPSTESRRRIWEKIWPRETPRSPELDLQALAEELEITGGHIRNIALAASFLAAAEGAEGAEVGMAHMAHAARREFRKLGKVLTPDALRPRARSDTGGADG